MFRKIHKWIKERLGMLKGKLSKSEHDAKKRLEKIEDMYVKAMKEESEVTSNVSEYELKYGLKKERYEVIDDYIMSKEEVNLDLNGSKIVASIDENTLKKNFRIPINSTNAGFNAKIRHYKEFHSIIENSSFIKTNQETNHNKNKYHKDIVKWHIFKNIFNGNGNTFEIINNISENSYGRFHVYESVWKKIKASNNSVITPPSEAKPLVTGSNTTIQQNNNDVNTNDEKSSKNDVKFSLFKDSKGKELTKERVEFFKDSKVRDENNNLLIVYHGTNA